MPKQTLHGKDDVKQQGRAEKKKKTVSYLHENSKAEFFVSCKSALRRKNEYSQNTVVHVEKASVSGEIDEFED